MAVAIAYLYFRMNALAATILLLQRPTPVELQSTSTLPFEHKLREYFQQLQTTTPAAPMKFIIDYKPEISQEFHVLDFFIFISIIAICLYVIWNNFRRKQRQHTFELVLEVINKQNQSHLRFPS